MVFAQAGGLETTNLVVTISLVALLLLASRLGNILDSAGRIAATFIGLAVGVLGHWSWLVILMLFLASSHKATKWRWDEKSAKGFCESHDGSRGWENVLANGGIPALVAVYAFFIDDWSGFFWVLTAGVAVAAADTWASEFGCLDERVRMITTMAECEPGVNGGFSPTGQLAALAGSALISVFALLIAWLPGGGDFVIGLQLAALITIVGWLGCQIDSVLGALLENRGLMTKGTVNAAAISAGMIFTYLLLNHLTWY